MFRPLKTEKNQKSDNANVRNGCVYIALITFETSASN